MLNTTHRNVIARSMAFHPHLDNMLAMGALNWITDMRSAGWDLNIHERPNDAQPDCEALSIQGAGYSL
ncbi:hypothetical protein FGO68_gene6853 [Halteria grandinella]|uniref:Uncharacterized protein n=1 Tax=Halteria grandinella TaxID=5974 RepID=A0A8J8NB10_HALGN|nr:hypothetical protein FGO68_gene6853 [Halteria grandinella]